MKYYTKVSDKEYVIEIEQDGQILVNDEPHTIDYRELPEAGMASLLLENRSIEAVVEERDDTWQVLILGELHNVTVQDERAYRLAQARGTALDSGEADIKAPMPGIIIAVPAAEGDAVKQGDKIVILESMKMENELRAPRDGVVSQINVAPGDGVEKDQVLAVIVEPDEDE
jgi:biotin carboxyl carrier protein